MGKAFRSVTITRNISIQFDAFIEEGDTEAAVDAARKLVDRMNVELLEAALDAQPQILGGDDLNSRDIEIGNATDTE